MGVLKPPLRQWSPNLPSLTCTSGSRSLKRPIHAFRATIALHSWRPAWPCAEPGASMALCGKPSPVAPSMQVVVMGLVLAMVPAVPMVVVMMVAPGGAGARWYAACWWHAAHLALAMRPKGSKPIGKQIAFSSAASTRASVIGPPMPRLRAATRLAHATSVWEVETS